MNFSRSLRLKPQCCTGSNAEFLERPRVGCEKGRYEHTNSAFAVRIERPVQLKIQSEINLNFEIARNWEELLCADFEDDEILLPYKPITCQVLFIVREKYPR